MRVAINFPSYNERRYSKPWIAVVTAWPVGGKPEVNFGSFNGREGQSGEVEVEALPGAVVRYGQKDYRNPRHTECNWGVVEADGTVREVTPSEAQATFRVLNNNPLQGFSDEALLAEIARRGL